MPEPRKLRVRFMASFETDIEVADGQSIADAVSDIEINTNDYLVDTFEVMQVFNEQGQEVDFP